MLLSGASSSSWSGWRPVVRLLDSVCEPGCHPQAGLERVEGWVVITHEAHPQKSLLSERDVLKLSVFIQSLLMCPCLRSVLSDLSAR